MSEREYTVVVHAGVDLKQVEAELIASTGSGPIPNRSVDIANPRPGSRRQTHFALTDAEAQELSKDSRIMSVEIPPDQRDDIQIGLHATQTGQFTRTDTLNQNYVNWGLLRTNMLENYYGNSTTANNNFEYALDGTGIDVVIQDSGIEANHPEWQDYAGVSRLKQIDWYTASGVSGTQSGDHYRDYDGHGSHCAGIAVGKTYGWAKNAHIYAQKLSGLEGSGDSGTGISVTNAFDTIRLWHNSKAVDPVTGHKRPTVVNMSWGYSSTQDGPPSNGSYRGVAWTWGADYTADAALWTGTGIVVPVVTATARRIPIRVPSVDAEIDDMISDGIHVIIAAGNDYYKGDVSTGDDYNNTVTYGATTISYHQGSSPHSDNAFIVGNIESQTQLDGSVYRDRTRGSSSRGPRVEIWAPGTNIVSVCSNTNIGYTTENYPDDTNYKIMSISGTSMAAPQVAGVIALHLQANPGLTPAEIKTRIIADAKNVIFDTASSTDYTAFNTSLMGASNNMLWNRYGRQPFIYKNQ